LPASRDAEPPRKSASTTKVAGAMVVLEFVGAEPTVLHERCSDTWTIIERHFRAAP
jgi:hypothetical protein